MESKIVVDYYFENKTLDEIRDHVESLIQRFGKDSKLSVNYQEKKILLIVKGIRESLEGLF